jgi:hypothetical protein
MSTRRFLTLLCLTLASAACGQKLPAKGCQSDAQCAADARCTSGVCTAGTRPVASVRPVGSVQAYALVSLDGSGSDDPDGDLGEHVWTIRALDAPCAPPEVASRTALAQVRFGCPGRYEVLLTVRDALGLESEPARQEVAVVPATGAPAVTAGPDLAVDHRCSGTPVLCRPEGLLRLTASASTGLSVRWTVQPPADRPLDAARRVRLLPDAGALAPEVELVSDDTAISGDWVFQVEARDAYGVVGSAATRVSVRNRPPVVTLAPATAFPHTFDAGRSAFLASGALGWTVVDPDGDAVDLAGIWRHLGDGDASTFDGDFVGTTVTFSVLVPYARPEDALGLRGGAGLLREIDLVATDSSGAVGRAAGQVLIGNRPPLALTGPYDTAVPHRFDAARSSYVAVARVGTASDPDGDPVFGTSIGAGPCATTSVQGSEALVECAAPYDGVPAVQRLAGRRTYAPAVRDPWEDGAATPPRTLDILNTAPTFTASSLPATTCVRGNIMAPNCYRVPDVSFSVQPRATDPDGDPVRFDATPARLGGTVTPASASCVGQDCPEFKFYEPQPLYYGTCFNDFSFNQRSFLTATDGSASTWTGVSPVWRPIGYYDACP